MRFAKQQWFVKYMANIVNVKNNYYKYLENLDGWQRIIEVLALTSFGSKNRVRNKNWLILNKVVRNLIKHVRNN